MDYYINKIWVGWLILFFPAVLSLSAQVNYTPEDSVIFERFLDYSGKDHRDIISVAGFFMDTPYVGGTLEGDEEEQLRINLRELDCMTFVENVMALYLISGNDKRNFKNFCLILQYIRYRDGLPDGYLSRLHYTSEWLDNNRQKEILVLPELSLSKEFTPGVSFMSAHCDLYPALKAHPEWCMAIKQDEDRINKLQLRYIPKEDVGNSLAEIHHGDIIAITTHIKGLDIAHLGFAVKENRTAYLLHASSEAKKVILSEETIPDYLANRKNHSGIIIARMIR